MRILLLQLDGKLPNLALMRIAAHHRGRGDDVLLQQVRNENAARRGLWEEWDLVYASLIFAKSKPVARALLESFPAARVGGSGWDLGKPKQERFTLERLGITALPDYSDYPAFTASMGFTQRGCRLSCSFCDVPLKEGKVRPESTVWDIWRGEPWPKHLLLLDNDFFGQADWPKRIEEIRAGGFCVCFTQGFNVRLIGDEEAAAIASVPYYNSEFTQRRLYCAWDNRKDEARLFRNLGALARYGVRPRDIMVYMLCGYWDGPRVTDDDLYRIRRLREFGAVPYPMPFVRNDELRGLQRWVQGAYDKRIPWDVWQRADYRPEKCGLMKDETVGLFD